MASKNTGGRKQQSVDEATEAPAASEAEVNSGDEETAAAATDLQAELTAAQEALAAKDDELQQVREALARARADFANYRRRTQQEQEEQAKFATALMVAEFLPILDNFERALETIPGELRFFSWLQGVDLVHQMARNVLEKRGLQPIDTHEKPFDPNYHEAVMREGEDDGGAVVVLEELQKGYVMHDRVLRPSLVKVGPPPQAEGADAAAAQETARPDAGEAASDSGAEAAADAAQA